jgi:hypothetical protein
MSRRPEVVDGDRCLHRARILLLAGELERWGDAKAGEGRVVAKGDSPPELDLVGSIEGFEWREDSRMGCRDCQQDSSEDGAQVSCERCHVNFPFGLPEPGEGPDIAVRGLR